MASAGQAQAHSSHPTHFSSPSGCRFSWCRPCQRGWVGTLTSGYSSVTTRVNIVVKVTPKPAILSRIRADRCSSPRSLSARSGWSALSDTGHLLAVVAGPGLVAPVAAHADRHRLARSARLAAHRRPPRPGRPDELLTGQWRHRVSTGEGV